MNKISLAVEMFKIMQVAESLDKINKESDDKQMKVCENCHYMKNNPDGGHCYMFEKMQVPCHKGGRNEQV
jgi:uncharacterized paraquat-inducible protein A